MCVYVCVCVCARRSAVTSDADCAVACYERRPELCALLDCHLRVLRRRGSCSSSRRRTTVLVRRRVTIGRQPKFSLDENALHITRVLLPPHVRRVGAALDATTDARAAVELRRARVCLSRRQLRSKVDSPTEVARRKRVSAPPPDQRVAAVRGRCLCPRQRCSNRSSERAAAAAAAAAAACLLYTSPSPRD